MYNGYKTHICTQDMHRHALMPLLAFGGKVRKGNQKSPSECQLSMTRVVILMLATVFYLSMMTEMNYPNAFNNVQ